MCSFAGHSVYREACRRRIRSAVISSEPHAIVASACGDGSVIAQIVNRYSLSVLGITAVPQVG